MDLQESYRAWKIESFRAGAARIEEQRTSPMTGIRLMTVSEDNNIRHVFFDKPLLRRTQLFDGRELMAHEENALVDDRQTLVGKTHRVAIVVAADGNDGCDFLQRPNQLVVADIAGMDDMADAGEEFQYPFIELAVCV